MGENPNPGNPAMDYLRAVQANMNKYLTAKDYYATMQQYSKEVNTLKQTNQLQPNDPRLALLQDFSNKLRQSQIEVLSIQISESVAKVLLPSFDEIIVFWLLTGSLIYFIKENAAIPLDNDEKPIEGEISEDTPPPKVLLTFTTQYMLLWNTVWHIFDSTIEKRMTYQEYETQLKKSQASQEPQQNI